MSQVSDWKVRLADFWLTRGWAERAVFEELSLAYEVKPLPLPAPMPTPPPPP